MTAESTSAFRLFIALTLPDDALDSLTWVQRHITEQALPVRAVKPDGLHLTLAFLGEISAERVPEVSAAMDRACEMVAPFELSLAGLGAFPGVRRPSVVWAGLTGELEALTTLHIYLNARLRDAGLPSETRAFRPHITLGRSRGAWSATQLAALRQLTTDVTVTPATWAVTAARLMRSELLPEGARYTTLYTSALKGQR